MDRNLSCLENTALIGRREILFNEGAKLPVVQVSIWAGMSEEDKKKVVEGLTKAFTDLGIPKEAVTVIFYEIPKKNWATGGNLHSEMYSDR